MPQKVKMETCLQALKTVFRSRKYQALGAASFALFFVLYLMTLPSAFTGGRVGFIALPFLTVELAIWSVVMATLIAIITAFIVFLIRQEMAVSKASTVGGVVGGIVGPILCCSPVLPITMSFIAGIFPALIGPSAWALQGFIATHQTELFMIASLLLLFALWQNARRIEAAPNCVVLPQGDS
jgi:hypothetical protein